MIGIAVSQLGKNHTLPLLTDNTDDSIRLVPFEKIQSIKYDFIAQNGTAGPGKKHLHIYQYTEKFCNDLKIPLLIRELPAIRNEQTSNWWRFSWNHYFLDEGIYPYDDSYNRWEELQKQFDIKIKEWHRPGDFILICLQKPMDSALNRLHISQVSYEDYCTNLIREIKKITTKKIIIRGHPKDPTNLSQKLCLLFSDVIISENISIYDDLNRSYCMITYNSTSSVESVFYGVPTITLDASCVSRDVTNHSLDQIENFDKFDRTEWFKKIAFMQWSPDEILSGKAWNYLKKIMPIQNAQ